MICGAAALYLFNPPTLPVCGFRWLTGRPCPLCGLTHAVFALAKGHMVEALHWHALSPFAVLLVAGAIWNSPRMTRVWTPSLIVFGAYGVWRMFAVG